MNDDPNAPQPAAAAIPIFRYTVCSIGGINIECQSRLDWVSFVKNAIADGYVMGDKVFQPMSMIAAIIRQDGVSGGLGSSVVQNAQLGGTNIYPFPAPGAD